MKTDDRYAWWRLLASVLLATLGGIGIWANVIVLTEIQREFAVDRSGASLPYAATMIGFGVGGLLMGRLIDRYGAMWQLSGWFDLAKPDQPAGRCRRLALCLSGDRAGLSGYYGAVVVCTASSA